MCIAFKYKREIGHAYSVNVNLVPAKITSYYDLQLTCTINLL